MCPNMLKDNIVRNRKRFVSGKGNKKGNPTDLQKIHSKIYLEFTF